MDLFEKSLVAIVVLGITAMVIAFFPDMKRYLKIRSM